MPPVLAFIVGLLCSELTQAGVWAAAMPGRTVRGYLEGSAAHFMTIAGVAGMVCFLWALNALDWVVKWLPDAMTGDWANTGIPFTPQVGAVMGFLVSLRVDKIIGAFQARFGTPTVKPPAGG